MVHDNSDSHCDQNYEKLLGKVEERMEAAIREEREARVKALGDLERHFQRAAVEQADKTDAPTRLETYSASAVPSSAEARELHAAIRNLLEDSAAKHVESSETASGALKAAEAAAARAEQLAGSIHELSPALAEHVDTIRAEVKRLAEE